MKHARQGGIRHWVKAQFLKYAYNMLTCKEFDDFVLHYLEGELSDKQRSVFERHLRMCRECREYLAAYKRTQEIAAAVSASSSAPVPDDVPEDLIAAILEARRH